MAEIPVLEAFRQIGSGRGRAAGLANPEIVSAGLRIPVTARAAIMPRAVLSTAIFSVISRINDAIKIAETSIISRFSPGIIYSVLVHFRPYILSMRTKPFFSIDALFFKKPFVLIEFL